jgi:aminoglycoside/choline kinase family phosphotransferase
MSPTETLPEPTNTIIWADPARAEAFGRWLDAVAPTHGLLPDSLAPASADASFRRYFRIRSAAGSFIVMDAPPDKEDSRPFVQVATLMAQAGVHAPRVLEWESEHGFMLLDDLGRRTMLEVLDPENPVAAMPRYRQAIDALVAWQLSSRPGVLPVYDEALLRRELALFPDWYLGRHRGVALEGSDAATLASAFDQIVARNLASPQVFVHRDFMPRNLMVDDKDAAAPLGVLDFQDAVYGPVTYDIASLMRDAFISWDEDLILDVTVRYWQTARKAGLPVGDDFGAFYADVEWMGLQRHLKVAGIFSRITLRDGKPNYLADTPRFMAYIRKTCDRYRALGPMLKVLDRIEGTEEPTGYAFGRV